MNATPKIVLLTYTQFATAFDVTNNSKSTDAFNVVKSDPAGLLQFNKIIFKFSYAPNSGAPAVIEGSNSAQGFKMQRGGYNLVFKIYPRLSGANLCSGVIPFIFPDQIYGNYSWPDAFQFNYENSPTQRTLIYYDYQNNFITYQITFDRANINWEVLQSPTLANPYYIDAAVQIAPILKGNTPATPFSLVIPSITVIGEN